MSSYAKQIQTFNSGTFTTMNEFQYIQKLGTGSFGNVNLYLHKPTQKKYAIKIMPGDIKNLKSLLALKQQPRDQGLILFVLNNNFKIIVFIQVKFFVVVSRLIYFICQLYLQLYL